MEFLLSNDLIEYSEVLRKYFSEKDKASWKGLAELGCFSTFLKEEKGGLGLGALSLAVTLEEVARVMSPLPVFETLVLGALPLSLYAEENFSLEKIAKGEEIYTSDISSERKIVLKSKKINGELNLVPSLDCADNLLVFVGTPANTKLLLIEKKYFNSLNPEEVSTFDKKSKYFHLTLNNFSDYKVVAEKADYSKYLDQADIFIAVYLSSLARKVLEMTVDYVKTRKQYGQAIGSFQAIQHKLADMAVLVEESQSLSRFAAWCIDNDEKQLVNAATAAKAFASENVIKVIEMAIQAHGGIGFTYEYELHFYLRKALVFANSLRKSEECLENLVQFTFSNP